MSAPVPPTQSKPVAIDGPLKVLLLENIHPSAEELFKAEGFSVERLKGALKPEELEARIQGVHLLGIRSKTNVWQPALARAPQLLAVGAFCIGTNQVDLKAANQMGTVVFNAPFSNTRSVAEL